MRMLALALLLYFSALVIAVAGGSYDAGFANSINRELDREIQRKALENQERLLKERKQPVQSPVVTQHSRTIFLPDGRMLVCLTTCVRESCTTSCF